ncbi:MAG: hypothetical protein GY863_01635, partial [bacterium]|nr:hypothetical protein [bacterium]
EDRKCEVEDIRVSRDLFRKLESVFLTYMGHEIPRGTKYGMGLKRKYLSRFPDLVKK